MHNKLCFHNLMHHSQPSTCTITIHITTSNTSIITRLLPAVSPHPQASFQQEQQQTPTITATTRAIQSLITTLILQYSNRYSKFRFSIQHHQRLKQCNNKHKLALVNRSIPLKGLYSSSTVSYNLVILVGDLSRTPQAKAVILTVSVRKVI